MKKITVFLIVLAAMLGLCIAVYAGDGTQSTTVTVKVNAGTYTVTVPEAVTFNLTDVVSATGYVGGNNQTRDLNKLGTVSISDVSNCRYIKCVVTAPQLKCGTETLPCNIRIETTEPKEKAETYQEIFSSSHTWYPYYTGRTVLSGQDGLYHLTPIAEAYFRILISESQAEGAELGTYTGSMSFAFSSSNKAPTE